MTVYCFNCQKELWDKHDGEKRRTVIVRKPHDFSDWYCIPCYRKIAKVGQHLSIGTRNEWSGRGQTGVEIQNLEVEVTEVSRDYVGWRTVKQTCVANPKPDTNGKGMTVTRGGFSLRENEAVCDFCGKQSEQAGFRHLFAGQKHASGKPVHVCDQCVVRFKRELHERGIR